MTSTLTYLSRRDVEAAGVTPAEAREAVLTVFADHAAGLNKSLPERFHRDRSRTWFPGDGGGIGVGRDCDPEMGGYGATRTGHHHSGNQ